MATRPITKPPGDLDGVLALGGPPPREDIVRAITPGFELRSTEDDSTSAPIMYGHFSVFSEWTVIDSAWEGLFLERVAPGCFAKTFSESRGSIKCLFQHGKDPTVGMKPLGDPSILKEDAIGAYYEVPLLDDAQYVQELLPGLRAGLYGMSFRFSVIQDEYVQHPRRSDYNPRGLPERTLTEVRVREFGPCTFGAYSEPTAAIRSLTDEFVLDRMAERDPERFRNLVARTGISVPLAIDEVLGDDAEPDGEQAEIDLAGGQMVPDLMVEAGFPPAPSVNRIEDEQGYERTYERAIQAATDTVWAIRPDKLDMIVQILDERSRGIRLTKEEIAERVGDTPERATPPAGPIAVIPIYGTILPKGNMMDDVSGGGATSIQQLQSQFKAAMVNSEVKGILLDVDSPGGSADLVEEMGAVIRDAVSANTKPVWAVANTDAYSAAYWLASQAERLAVTPSGGVGSVGVYMPTVTSPDRRNRRASRRRSSRPGATRPRPIRTSR